jgi:hypothetical protein
MRGTSLSVIVTVHIPADISVVLEVNEKHPEYTARMGQLAREHGITAHTRATRPGAVLEIDTFETEEAYRAFEEASSPTVTKLAELRGIAEPEIQVWTVVDV